MTKYAFILGMGVLLGYFWGHRSSPTPKPEQKLPTEQIAKPSLFPKLKPAPMKAHAEIVQAKKIEMAPKLHFPEEFSLSLNEDDISAIEADLGELRRNAKTTYSDRGWRVHFENADNALQRLGLKDGDLVRSDLLNSAKENPETSVLASRVEDILRSLEQ